MLYLRTLSVAVSAWLRSPIEKTTTHARSEVSVHTRAYWSLAFNAERLGNCLLGEGMSLLRIELAVGSCAK